MMRPGDVQCWRCGIFYVAALPVCPTGVLGCGAPKRFVAELAELNAVESAIQQQVGRLMHLANSLSKQSGQPAAMKAMIAIYYARKTLESCALMRKALADTTDEKEAA
jgi:hypothetical protein